MERNRSSTDCHKGGCKIHQQRPSFHKPSTHIYSLINHENGAKSKYLNKSLPNSVFSTTKYKSRQIQNNKAILSSRLKVSRENKVNSQIY